MKQHKWHKQIKAWEGGIWKKNLTFEELIKLEDITQRIKDRANFYCEVVWKKAEQLSNSIPSANNYEIEFMLMIQLVMNLY